MTCIVAVKGKKYITIGADSAGISGCDLTIRKDVKVFKRYGMIFGFTSSFRMGQILRFGVKLPKLEDVKPQPDLYEFMCTTFIDQVRCDFRDRGFSSIANNTELGGQFIVGYKGRIFLIDSDFQVGESIDDYAAIGCGANAALGYLYATENNTKISTDDRAIKALECAEHFSNGVRGPYNLEHLEICK